jgi:hypothetical protein
MSSSGNKVVPLRAASPAKKSQRASEAANRVRRQLSLLQGYADLMDGLSPAQHVQILHVMAEKTRELTEALRPFLDAEEERPAIGDYREARSRTQELLSDYRMLLGRLRDTTAALRETPRPISNR